MDFVIIQNIKLRGKRRSASRSKNENQQRRLAISQANDFI